MPHPLRVAAALLFTSTLAAAQTTTDPPPFQRWRSQIRQTLFVPDHLPPLQAKLWSSFSATPDIQIDRVTYQTADGMIVPAVVYRPLHVRGKVPGIVIVNGHGGDKFTWYAVYSGLLFAQAGAEVITYDPIGEGERNVERKSHTGAHDRIWPAPAGVDAAEFHSLWGRHLAGLMQVDAMQAVSYLRQRPEVDPARIAVLGYSMGAFVAGITGAIDPRIHAVLLSGGGTYDDLADGGKPFDAGKLPCQAPPWLALRVLGPGAHARGAILYALNAQRGPMLVVNGSQDEVMGIPQRPPQWFASLRAQAAALLAAYGVSTANLFTTRVDEGKGHRTAWLERPEVEWLNQQLHFARWDAHTISAAPVTLAADWIQHTGADVSPNYLRPDREGGLMLLGAGFPAITRDQLTVLPAVDWEHLQPRLTYEGWAAQMNTQLTRELAHTTTNQVTSATSAPPSTPQ